MSLRREWIGSFCRGATCRIAAGCYSYFKEGRPSWPGDRAGYMERILVVEDHRTIHKALKRLFESEGYGVEIAVEGKAGVEAFRAAPPALVILDLRLPGMAGEDVCRLMKREAPSIPVIVLSAKSDVEDKVVLLELGADDYVTKPFSPRELLARVHAAMRRANRNGMDEVFSFGDVTLDFARMEASRSGEPVGLTSLEFKLLRFFAQNAGRVISRHELLTEVWGYRSYPSSRTVDSQMLKLRQRLEKDPASPVHFRTIHGAGYKFVP
jgi:DNA-binding response OmpR family regulator